MRTVVNAAIIRDGRLLLVRESGKVIWTLPGGQPEDSEDHEACLLREIQEELPGIQIISIVHYGSFSGTSPHKKDEILVSVYLTEATGSISPGAEIAQTYWADHPHVLVCSEVTLKIIASLQANSLLPTLASYR